MSFSGLFFVTCFLPAFTILYFLMPGIRSKNLVLLLGSLLFYSFGGIWYLLLLILMAAAAFCSGKLIRAAERWHIVQGFLLMLTVFLFLAVLAVFKYSGFILRTLDEISDAAVPTPDFVLPLGISFYTFKLISYVSDIYNGRLEPASFPDVLLYTVIFHQSMQGPIVRFGDMKDDLHHRKASPGQFADGVFRFVIGLSKKLLLADHAGRLAETFLPTAMNSGSTTVAAAYLGSLFYMLQLYLDFSAYSDMALGLGQMIGFHYPENFNYPYMAVSVRDFWKRWHISLSSFFRDYVYIPLGGSRVGFIHLVFNLLIVWSLTGLWHGASWNFILWGLYYFVFIVLENIVRRVQKRLQDHSRGGSAETEGAGEASGEQKTQPRGSVLLRAAGHVYALAVIFFGWVLFRFTDFAALRKVLLILSGRSGAAMMDAVTAMTLKNNIFFLLAAVLASTSAGRRFGESRRKSLERLCILENVKKRHLREAGAAAEVQEEALTRRRQRAERIYYCTRILWVFLLLFLSILSMVGNSYTPFLYNQF